MPFHAHQYQQAIDKITSGLQTLNTKMQQIPGAANNALSNPILPDSVKKAIVWMAEKMVNILKAVIDKIVELLKGAAAPIFFFTRSYTWQDVKGKATGVV